MLTQMQAWGRTNNIWVIIVAHPRKLTKLNGKNELEELLQRIWIEYSTKKRKKEAVCAASFLI